jgi:hypothetical protein
VTDHPPPYDALMASSDASILIARAEVARAAGDLDTMRATLVEAFRAARSADDNEAMAEAALALPSSLGFGVHPGQVPAYLHEAYLSATDQRTRARLLVGLTRAWTYGGEAARAADFAAEAQDLAALVDDPAISADALDAALLTCWGPDDFAERIRLAARLEEVSGHLADPELRMTAHLWRLTTAWECLDVLAVQRQLRALDLLAEETGSARVTFFALSRRAMHAQVVGDLVAATELRDRLGLIAAGLAEADVPAVLHSLDAELARQQGDRPRLAAEAEEFAAFALAEGIPSILGQAAVYRLDAGEPELAGLLVDQLPDLSTVPHDVDTLLILTTAGYVAAGTGRLDLAAEALALLEPYAGRSVLNAGAVSFHWVVDDVLARLAAALDLESAPGWSRSAQAAYRRLGASWWSTRLGEDLGTGGPVPVPAPGADEVHLSFDGEVWSIGRRGATFVLPDLRGLHHLRHLLERPGVEVAAVDLADAAGGHPGTGVRASDLGAVLDEAAKRAFRRRLGEIDAEIDEADAWSDPARLERATVERQAILDELSAAVGLAGRDRRVGGTAERARMAVRKTITAAIARIERHDPAVARLLRDTVRTGTWCRFDPDPGRPVHWVLDVPPR